MLVYDILLAYLALTLISGFIHFSRSKSTPEDYFLADRGVSLVVLFFTLIATNFSAFFFLGFAGAGYRIGLAYYAMMAMGTALAGLSIYWIGNLAWHLGKERGYITPPELIGDLSNSKFLKSVYLVFMVLFTLPYLALQPIGAGIILNEITHGQIPYMAGATFLTAFIVLYVFLGGMRSVAITDLIQGILMLVLIFVAVFYIVDAFGGLEAANNKLFQTKPALFSREGLNKEFTPKKWLSMLLLWLCCVPMFPHMFMRFFIAKRLGALKASTVLYSLVPVFLFICPVLIGALGHLSFERLPPDEVNSILPKMMNLHAPEAIAGLIMVGALAAFMSTLDSQLLALSTMLTRDVYKNWIGKDASFKKEVTVGKWLIVLLAGIGLLIAIDPPDAIYTFVKQTFTGYAILFPATIAVLYGKKVSGTACAISILIGEAIFLGHYFGWIPDAFFLGFEPFLPILALCTLIILGGRFIPKSS